MKTATRSQMTDYLGIILGGDLSDTSMTDAELQVAVSNMSHLSYEDWCEEYVPADLTPVRHLKVIRDPQIEFRAQLRDLGMRRPLPPRYEIHSVRECEYTVVVRVTKYDVHEGFARDSVKRATLMLLEYRLSDMRLYDEIEIPDGDFEAYSLAGQYAVVMDADRAADKLDQYTSCHRPGALGSNRDPRDAAFAEDEWARTLSVMAKTERALHQKEA